jgi:hypothetical protein
VVSTLRSFAEEYRSHIHDKKCVAGVCGRDPNGDGEKAEGANGVKELSEVGA